MVSLPLRVSPCLGLLDFQLLPHLWEEWANHVRKKSMNRKYGYFTIVPFFNRNLALQILFDSLFFQCALTAFTYIHTHKHTYIHTPNISNLISVSFSFFGRNDDRHWVASYIWKE